MLKGSPYRALQQTHACPPETTSTAVTREGWTAWETAVVNKEEANNSSNQEQPLCFLFLPISAHKTEREEECPKADQPILLWLPGEELVGRVDKNVTLPSP